MSRTKFSAIALAAVALCAALALLVGCSGSSNSSGSASASAASTSASAASASASTAAASTSAAAASTSASAASTSASAASASAASTITLEEYFAKNQSEWDDAVKQIKESGGDVLDVEMFVKDNQITQIMTFKDTYNSEQVARVKQSLEEQSGDLVKSIEGQLQSMERLINTTGITWVFQYRNGDGSLIYALEVGGNK